jgi:hypothetical protein
MQDERLAGGLAVLIATAALALANFAGSGDNGGAVPYAISVAACVIVAAVLFGRVLPATANPGRASWILAALALLSCVVFWSGLPATRGQFPRVAGRKP